MVLEYSLGVPEYPLGVLEYPLTGLLMQRLVLHPLKRSENAGLNATYPFYCIFRWNRLFPLATVKESQKNETPIKSIRPKSGTFRYRTKLPAL
jgi:hypothetical protein